MESLEIYFRVLHGYLGIFINITAYAESNKKEGKKKGTKRASRHPYCHTPSLETSFSEGSSNDTSGTSLDDRVDDSAGTTTQSICSKCEPVLRYADIFKQLVHQGTELKKKKKVNPNPKKPGTHYWDVKRQNDWLRENMFDELSFLLCMC